MSCKHPLIRAYSNNRTEIKIDGTKMYKTTIIKPNDEHESIEDFMKKYHPNMHYDLIPCKKCIGCRLDYSKEWANRGYLESLQWKNNYFVTLTYNDENIPKNGSLNPKHFTTFIKDLRANMRDNGIQKEGIRFMGCGEYGEKTERPHYHIILFNCNLPLESFYNPRINKGNTYWQNKIIEEEWNYGISNISDVNWNTIAYTARYITKKINGKQSEEHYQGKEKEFFRTSRKPGIGGYYYQENAEKIYENDEIIVKNKKGVISQRVPKYFDRLKEKENPEYIKNLKKERKKRQRQNELIKDEKSTNTRQERLEIEERSLQNKTLKLIREMEKEK